MENQVLSYNIRVNTILNKLNPDIKHLNHKCQYTLKSRNCSLLSSHSKGKAFICALANRKFTTAQERLQLPFATTVDPVPEIASLVTGITNNANSSGGHHNYNWPL
jgi:hypothetical protein